MADRGRDLKIGILSDASKFDLSGPAEDLEQVGDAAKDMGQDVDKATDELKRLAVMGKDAEQALERLNKEAKDSDIERLGKDAKETASKVDSAFEKIAASSRSNLRKVDADADKASRGLDEFKDEADSTAKEAAASFSDVESGLDAIQEIAANAFAGFGPAGAAAGALAAVGIGVLFSSLQKATDKANEAKDRIIGMAQAASEAGTTFSESGITDAIREWGYAIGDNKSFWELWQKSNLTNFEIVSQRAEKLGLDFRDMFRGMSGTDPQAALRIMEDIDSQIAAIDASQRALNAALPNGAKQMVDAEKIKRGQLSETRKEVEAALGMSEETARLLALEEKANDGTARALEDRKAALDATKESIESVGEASIQSSIDQIKSIDDVIEAQEKALRAQQDFADNTKEVLDEVGQEGVDWAQSFGEHAPKMMQLLADAPKKKQAEIIKNYRAAGRTAGSATADGIYSQVGAVSRAGTAIYNAAEAAVRKQGGIEIDFKTKTSNITRETRLAMAEAQAYARRNPIVIRTRFAPSGQRPIRDVP